MIKFRRPESFTSLVDGLKGRIGNLSRSSLLSLLAIIFFTSFAHGQNADSKREPDKVPATGPTNASLDPLDKLMTSFVKEHHVPGAALAVAHNGKLIYSRGFGLADKEKEEAVKPSSLFRIASVSKPITAVAILQLVERKKLKLDDKVFNLLKLQPHLAAGAKFDPRWKQVTILQVLHHTGGWDPEKSFDPMFRPNIIAKAVGTEAPADQKAIIRYMMGLPLDFDPGTRYAYSNFGYCILGQIIELVTGQTYEAYVRKEVLGPLGAQGFRLGKTLLEGRAKGEVKYYNQKNGKGKAVVGPMRGKDVPLPYGAWYLEAMDSHGGWIASAPDLVRFAVAFEDPEHCKVLNPHSIATMFATPEGPVGHRKNGKPKATYYGCGWQVRPGKPGPTYWHSGALDGTSSLLVHRNDGYTWAVLFNSMQDAKGKDLADEIDRLIHEAVDELKK